MLNTVQQYSRSIMHAKHTKTHVTLTFDLDI